MTVSDRLSLRARLFLLISSIVLAMLIISTIGFYVIEAHLEELEVREYLEQEAGRLKSMGWSPEVLPPNLVYFARDDAPDAVRKLAPGEYRRVLIGSYPHYVLAISQDSGTLYLGLPENEIERLEMRLLIAFAIWVMLLTLVAMWFAYRMSARLVGPVADLASRVEALTPAGRGVRLAADFRGEEVERIARAMDRYLERLDGFVEREQSFTATASHELRTPLSVISGAAEILANDKLNESQRKTIERIRRAASEMHQFIDALLALARHHDGSEYRAETDVAQVLRRVCQDARERLPSALRLDCAGREGVHVKAPPTLVHIVLSNIIANAVRHARTEVRVSCDETDITVTDDGAGMSPEVQAHAFDRHFSSANGGAGIGLYLVKRIADQYGWLVSVDSNSSGTTVRVVLH